MEMRRGYVIVFDPPMVDVAMIAVADRAVRGWKRALKNGKRIALVHNIAIDSNYSLKEAEWLLDTIVTGYSREKKKGYARIKASFERD